MTEKTPGPAPLQTPCQRAGQWAGSDQVLPRRTWALAAPPPRSGCVVPLPGQETRFLAHVDDVRPRRPPRAVESACWSCDFLPQDPSPGRPGPWAAGHQQRRDAGAAHPPARLPEPLPRVPSPGGSGHWCPSLEGALGPPCREDAGQFSGAGAMRRPCWFGSRNPEAEGEGGTETRPMWPCEGTGVTALAPNFHRLSYCTWTPGGPDGRAAPRAEQRPALGCYLLSVCVWFC